MAETIGAVREGDTTVLEDPACASLAAALLDGRAWTAREIALALGAQAKETSQRVCSLLRAGIVCEVPQGRHTYFRLAGDEAADLVRSAGIAPLPVMRAPRSSIADPDFRAARTCYRHLAGRLGIAVTQGMLRRGWIDERWSATPVGRRAFTAWGTDPDTIGRGAACLDRTQRRFHLGGDLGTVLGDLFFARSWVIRPGARTRAVRLTEAGRRALAGAHILPD